MEHALRVSRELGENNINILLEEFRAGKINIHQIKTVALEMGGGAHGVYDKNKDRTDLQLADLMKLILDQWYKDILHKPDFDGYEKMLRILNNPDVGLNYLTQDMRRETLKLEVGPVQVSSQIKNNLSNSSEKSYRHGCFQNNVYQTDSITGLDASKKLLYQSENYENKHAADKDDYKLLKHVTRMLPAYCPIFSSIVFLLIAFGVGIGIGIGIGHVSKTCENENACNEKNCNEYTTSDTTSDDNVSIVRNNTFLITTDGTTNFDDLHEKDTISTKKIDLVSQLFFEKPMATVANDEAFPDTSVETKHFKDLYENGSMSTQNIDCIFQQGVKNLTELMTRSFTVHNGKFNEFHGCQAKQSKIPDLPKKLVDVAVIYTMEFGLLSCGGLDVGDNPAPDHKTWCYTHIIGSEGWERFEHQLNTNRRGSHMKRNRNKLYIIGGRSSDPRHDCYPSTEVLDLENLSDGWKQEESPGECFTDQVIEVPCI